MVNVIYPVGSIYTSVNNVNPSALFGGTWEQIKDTFLLSAGDSYTAGNTGGEASHKLTMSEMPSHTHTFTGTAASHTHHSKIFTSNNENFTMAINGIRLDGVSWCYSGDTTAGSTGGDSCGITSSTSITPKGTNSSTGSGTAHNNMPPYLTVYMWKRTA